MSALYGIEIETIEDLEYAASRSDVITTCTPSSAAYLLQDYIRPGTFIGAVGADSVDKQELDPKILGNNTVVVDILDQSAAVGELHHAIEAGLLKKEDAHGEVGDVITGEIAGRSTDEEIIVYDATGTAIQDTAAAATCYHKANHAGIGKYFNVFE
jgi:ornithine cyclodeaminase/alanine dehydrogenase-like protein (mu-crystallin family)